MVDNFSDLYLREDVVSALKEIGVTKPTVIQMLAIPKIVRGKNVLCAAETGTCSLFLCCEITYSMLMPLLPVSNDQGLERHWLTWHHW